MTPRLAHLAAGLACVPLVAVGTTAYAAAPPSAAATAAVTGQVVDLVGLPLDGVEVVARTDEGFYREADATSTDADGTYSFTGLDPGDYRFFYSVAGRADEWYGDSPVLDLADSVRLAGGQARALDDVALDLAATMTGTITVDGGAPAPGGQDATLDLVDSDGLHPVEAVARAEAGSGTYTFDRLAAGTYLLSFLDFDEGRSPEYYDDTPIRSRAALVTVVAGQVVPALDADLVADSYVTGTLTRTDPDSSFGAPLEGATATAYTRQEDGTYAPVASATTAADGTYLLPHLAPGRYVVVFSAPHFRTVRFEGGALDLVAGSGENLASQRLDRAAQVAGRVLVDRRAPDQATVELLQQVAGRSVVVAYAVS